MNANTAWTDFIIAAGYILGPLFWVMFHGDQLLKPTPEQARSRNT